MGVLGTIREGLARTTQQIVGRFEDIVARADAPDVRSTPLGGDTLEALEDAAILLTVAKPG